MKKYLALLLLVFTTFTSTHADVLLKGGGVYIQSKDDDGSGETSTTRMPLDLLAGYITEKRWVIGGTYAMESIKIEGSGTSTKIDRTSTGVTAGYLSGREVGGYIFGTYFFSSEYETSGVTWKGSGMELDLGFKVALRRVSLGTQLAYKIFDYKLDSAKLKHTRIDPGVYIILEF